MTAASDEAQAVARARRAMPGTGGDTGPDPIGEQAEAKATPWASRFHAVPAEWFTKPAPPRRWLLTDTRTEPAAGVFPLGKVGLIAAEGGAGKTSAVTQLTVALATGMRWLGTFHTPNPGKVLLVLGEEDEEEGWRRIYRAGQAAGIETAPTNIVIAPLAGVNVVGDDQGAAFFVWLREYVTNTGPYAGVVLDPVSRFEPADAEKDNAVATRFITSLESLIEPSGGASVLASAHTNQTSRGGGKVNATSVRGVTGTPDAARWVSTMEVVSFEGDGQVARHVVLAVPKTNYALPPQRLMLRYGDGGSLVPLTDDERAAVEQARDAADPRAKRATKKEQSAADARAKEGDEVVKIVREQRGIITRELLRLVKARVHVADEKAQTIIARLIDQGRIRREQVGKPYRHYVVDPRTPEAVNGAGSPHPQDVLSEMMEGTS